jgi:hypothetical protein
MRTPCQRVTSVRCLRYEADYDYGGDETSDVTSYVISVAVRFASPLDTAPSDSVTVQETVKVPPGFRFSVDGLHAAFVMTASSLAVMPTSWCSIDAVMQALVVQGGLEDGLEDGWALARLLMTEEHPASRSVDEAMASRGSRFTIPLPSRLARIRTLMAVVAHLACGGCNADETGLLGVQGG